jgi:ketosteroid isomerase-like protein
MSAIATPADTTANAAEAFVAGFTEGWRAPASAEAAATYFERLLAPDVRLIQPQLPTGVGYQALRRQFLEPLFALMPDMRCEVDRWAARGNEVFIELTVFGTVGRRPVRMRACDRFTLRNGLAIERESHVDPTPLLVAVARTPRTWPRFLRNQARLRLSAPGRGRGVS